MYCQYFNHDVAIEKKSIIKYQVHFWFHFEFRLSILKKQVLIYWFLNIKVKFQITQSWRICRYVTFSNPMQEKKINDILKLSVCDQIRKSLKYPLRGKYRSRSGAHFLWLRPERIWRVAKGREGPGPSVYT